MKVECLRNQTTTTTATTTTTLSPSDTGSTLNALWETPVSYVFQLFNSNFSLRTHALPDISPHLSNRQSSTLPFESFAIVGIVGKFYSISDERRNFTSEMSWKRRVAAFLGPQSPITNTYSRLSNTKTACTLDSFVRFIESERDRQDDFASSKCRRRSTLPTRLSPRFFNHAYSTLVSKNVKIYRVLHLLCKIQCCLQFHCLIVSKVSYLIQR